jgi:hypothetical protein
MLVGRANVRARVGLARVERGRGPGRPVWPPEPSHEAGVDDEADVEDGAEVEDTGDAAG